MKNQKYSELLGLARESIKTELEEKELKISEGLKKKYSKKQACFVTLTLNGKLRGCIGSLEPVQELWKDVVENARNAAFSDPRFRPLSKEELEKAKIEVSVLTVPRKLDYHFMDGGGDLLKKILGKGVIIKKSWNSATYLPQVWEDLPDAENFISSLCVKAGLPDDLWKAEKLEVWTYDVQKVKEE